MAYQTLSLRDFCDNNASFDPVFIQVVQELPMLSKKGPWLAGGSVRKFLDNKINEADYDIFFPDREVFTGWCNDLTGRGATLVSESNLNQTFDYHGWKIQAIHYDMQSTLIKTMNRFDMAMCQCGFDGELLYWSDQAILDIKEKAITFTNADDPIYSINRAIKFSREGYTPRHGEIARLVKGVVKDPKKLTEPRKGMSGTTVSMTMQDNGNPSLTIKADQFAIIKPSGADVTHIMGLGGQINQVGTLP